MGEKLGRAKRTHAATLKACEVVKLLAARHTLDIFFDEVKDGPTWGGTHLRLDALAIRKSWSPVRLMGYEVKVSRADWLGDRKWEAYLPLAHEFSIAAPAGVVQIEELPATVGLYEVSSTGATLRIVRKPVYREIELPGELLVYLLMSRTKPCNPRAPHEWTREERIASWRKKLEDGREIAYSVSEKLRERVKAAERAAGRGAELAEVDAWLEKHNPRGWGSLTERLDAALEARPEKLNAAALALVRAAEHAHALLAEHAPKVPA